MLKGLALVFFTSMVPVLELRASIPMGIAMDLPSLHVFVVSVMGSVVPVPFIMLFIRRLLQYMETKEGIWGKIAKWLEQKAAKGAESFYKYAMLGLFIFVAVPLPGTGAWSGALVAAMLNLRMKNAVPVILLGIAVAGLIVTGISIGAFAGASAIL